MQDSNVTALGNANISISGSLLKGNLSSSVGSNNNIATFNFGNISNSDDGNLLNDFVIIRVYIQPSLGCKGAAGQKKFINSTLTTLTQTCMKNRDFFITIFSFYF